MKIESTLRQFIRSRINKKTNIAKDLRIVDNTLYVPSEIVFVDQGRRKGAKQPPVKEILKFMRKRGIGNKLSTAYAIAHSIKVKGIKPKPIINDLANLYVTLLLSEPLSAKEDGFINKQLNNL